jgi:hypothetical protein
MRYTSSVRVLIIAVIILALISASAMAISKSDLISSYKAPSGTTPSKSPVSPTSPSPIPTTSPVWTLPTPIPTSGNSYFPSWFAPALPVFPSKGGSSSLKPTLVPTQTTQRIPGATSPSSRETGGVPYPLLLFLYVRQED